MTKPLDFLFYKLIHEMGYPTYFQSDIISELKREGGEISIQMMYVMIIDPDHSYYFITRYLGI